MNKKNYHTILGPTILIIIVNYFTGFMFMTNYEILILLWTIINVLIFPIWIIYYIYGIAKSNQQKHFISGTIIALCYYLLTYLIPSLDFFNFKTFSFNGDRASAYVLKSFMFSGFITLIISSVILHIKLRNSTQSLSRKN